jgi:predicted deacetylase
MASFAHGSAPGTFCVIVHDVTPVFTAEIDRILDAIGPLIGDRLGGAVVPAWHGRRTTLSDRRQFAAWANRFGEFLLHGLTHYRETGRGLVSWCTRGSDEFGGVTLGRMLERLRTAKAAAENSVGRSLSGFVPPAWRLAATIADLRTLGIEYLMRFRSLESINRRPISLASWSWDWGCLPGTHRAPAALGALRLFFDSHAVPIVVVHPHDVRRRLLPTIVRLICQFVSSGALPVLPCELISPVAAEQST